MEFTQVIDSQGACWVRIPPSPPTPSLTLGRWRLGRASRASRNSRPRRSLRLGSNPTLSGHQFQPINTVNSDVEPLSLRFTVPIWCLTPWNCPRRSRAQRLPPPSAAVPLHHSAPSQLRLSDQPGTPNRRRQVRTGRAIWIHCFDSRRSTAPIHTGSATRLLSNCYWRVCPLDTVSTLLGHSSVKITERHYKPWVRSLQRKLEDEVKRAWT